MQTSSIDEPVDIFIDLKKNNPSPNNSENKSRNEEEVTNNGVFVNSKQHYTTGSMGLIDNKDFVKELVNSKILDKFSICGDHCTIDKKALQLATKTSSQGWNSVYGCGVMNSNSVKWTLKLNKMNGKSNNIVIGISSDLEDNYVNGNFAWYSNGFGVSNFGYLMCKKLNDNKLFQHLDTVKYKEGDIIEICLETDYESNKHKYFRSYKNENTDKNGDKDKDSKNSSNNGTYIDSKQHYTTGSMGMVDGKDFVKDLIHESERENIHSSSPKHDIHSGNSAYINSKHYTTGSMGIVNGKDFVKELVNESKNENNNNNNGVFVNTKQHYTTGSMGLIDGKDYVKELVTQLETEKPKNNEENNANNGQKEEGKYIGSKQHYTTGSMGLIDGKDYVKDLLTEEANLNSDNWALLYRINYQGDYVIAFDNIPRGLYRLALAMWTNGDEISLIDCTIEGNQWAAFLELEENDKLERKLKQQQQHDNDIIEAGTSNEAISELRTHYSALEEENHNQLKQLQEEEKKTKAYEVTIENLQKQLRELQKSSTSTSTSTLSRSSVSSEEIEKLKIENAKLKNKLNEFEERKEDMEKKLIEKEEELKYTINSKKDLILSTSQEINRLTDLLKLLANRSLKITRK